MSRREKEAKEEEKKDEDKKMKISEPHVGRKKQLRIRRRDELWSRTVRNPDVSTVPFAHPFACSLAPLTHWPAPQCSLGSRTLLPLFVCSLTHSFTPELIGK